MTVPNPQLSQDSDSGSGCLSGFVRLTWIFGGVSLVYCAVYVAMRKGPVVADILLFVFALLLIVARFLDIRYLDGETMNQQPATIKHWRRYSFFVLIITSALYALAKFIAQKQ
ncbi:MAG: hypothetical protein NTZ26_00260 [Candidatus Aminicenantes bacterium]|nr:hypothetical protein [Candidatus Aminicenantes bacterium]